MINSSIYDGVVERIQDVYSSCSALEQKQLLQILKEISITGDSQTLEQLWLADFKAIPVSIDEFICNDYYLGGTNRQGTGVYPYWRQVARDIFNHGNRYYEIILSGATRIGKSSTMTMLLSYMLYRLMLYRNPHEYFKKKEVSRFTIGFANLTKELAASVAYREFNDTLKASPWFMEHGSVSRSDRSFFYIPEGDKIDIVAGSSAEHFLGMQLWACLVGSTQILTADGPIAIEMLSGKTSTVFQYSCDGRLIESDAKIEKTKMVSRTIRITLEDGSEIEGTPDHLLMLTNGEYKKLEDLTEGDDVMVVEQWAEIDGHPYYQVSNFGNVKCLEHEISYMFYGKMITRVIPEHLLSGSVNGDGYKTVQLGQSSNLVHRLVAAAFLPEDSSRTIVNHKDGNKLNNCSYNLEWVTTQENTHHFRTAQCFEEARRLHSIRQSHSHIGQTHSVSDEVRHRMSIIHRAENLSPERRAKISEGLRGRKLSEQSRKKIGQANAESQTGKKVVNDGIKEKRVDPDKVAYYLSSGWKLGRVSRYWINNGTQERLVPSSEIPDGWEAGRLK